jgi:hypothetical protein
MHQKSIQVIPVNPNDWMVREEGGREFGHYPNQQDALHVGRKLARKRGAQLRIHDNSAEPAPEDRPKSLFGKLFGG